VPGAVWRTTGIGGLLRRIFFALGMMSISFCALIIPIAGWVFFPIGIIFSVVLLFKKQYSGYCPWCGSWEMPGGEGSVRKCGSCKHQYVHRGDRLEKIQ
jgi:hypothetical protein